MTRDYLATEVLTATPQRLHLILIEAALRSANRSRQHFDDTDRGIATESLIRAQLFVTEMLSHLSARDNAQLALQIAAVYRFIHRSLVDAGARHDIEKLNGAIRVLEIERETWRQAAQQAAQRAPAVTLENDSLSSTGHSFVA